tara:strand:+ start:792 stop:1004 length:213 start_codon:yes stop_codon:yes gene_type:complete
LQKGDLVEVLPSWWGKTLIRVGLLIGQTSWQASPDPRVPDVLHRRVGWKVLVDGKIENIENHLIKKLDNS